MVPGSSITEYNSEPPITQLGGKSSSLKLPIEETPYFEDTTLSHWKSVVAYGADPRGINDSSTAVQAAIDSGATTVYFPTGLYVVSRTILVRGKVRMLEGFDSSINPAGSVFRDPDNPVPFFKIEDGTSDVTLNHMRLGVFYPHPSPGVIFVQQDSPRPVVLRDSVIGMLPANIAYQNTSRGTGTLFVEDVAGHPWHILFPQKVFARQLNPEGNATKLINKGGRVWILGLKTEGTGTNIETDQGGSTELLGGLIYPVWKVPDEVPGFRVIDSRASLIYAVSNYKPGIGAANFRVQVEEKQRGVTRTLLSTSLRNRGSGTMVSLYSSGDSATGPGTAPVPRPK
jgi:hypothetical protein